MRGDSAARGAWYQIMRQVGALNADEIRDLEDRPPIADGSGQTYLQPVNMAPLGTTPDAPPTTTDEEDDNDPAGDRD